MINRSKTQFFAAEYVLFDVTLGFTRRITC